MLIPPPLPRQIALFDVTFAQESSHASWNPTETACSHSVIDRTRTTRDERSRSEGCQGQVRTDWPPCVRNSLAILSTPRYRWCSHWHGQGCANTVSSHWSSQLARRHWWLSQSRPCEWDQSPPNVCIVHGQTTGCTRPPLLPPTRAPPQTVASLGSGELDE